LTRPYNDCVIRFQKIEDRNIIEHKKKINEIHYKNSNECKEYMNTWKEGEIPWDFEDEHENKTSVKNTPPTTPTTPTTPIYPKPLYTFQRLLVDI